MEYDINNDKYIPGIATYGARGNKGDRGLGGISLYYSSYYDLDDNPSQKDEISNKIHNNLLLSNNPRLSDSDSILPDGRVYNVGDTFVDPNGNVFYLKINTDSSILFTRVGQIQLN